MLLNDTPLLEYLLTNCNKMKLKFYLSLALERFLPELASQKSIFLNSSSTPALRKVLIWVFTLFCGIILLNNEAMKAQTSADCPTIFIDDLNGVPGYPYINDLSVCGVPDTISYYILNTAGQDLLNSEFELALPPGLEYSGYIDYLDPGYPLLEGDISDLQNPSFIMPTFGADSVQIVSIGLQAVCQIYDNDPNQTYEIDPTFDFLIKVESDEKGIGGVLVPCSSSFSGDIDYGPAIIRPTINIRDNTSDPRNVVISGSQGCTDVTVSQDGLGASVSEFFFEVYGGDGVNLLVSDMSIGGNSLPYTYDPINNVASVTVDASFLPGGALGAGQTVDIRVCYEAPLGCDNDQGIFDIRYEASFGCGGDGEPCVDPSIGEGTVTFTPNYGANAVYTVTQIDNGGPAICGTNAIFQIEVTSAQSDPIQGLWENLRLGFQVCEGDALEAIDVRINGSSLPAGTFYYENFDFIVDSGAFPPGFDPDPGTGFTDFDGDGIFDDLLGGETITLEIEVGIKCQNPDEITGCASIDCTFDQAWAGGLRHCGQEFQSFDDVVPAPSFVYGPATYTHPNETDISVNQNGTLLGYWFDETTGQSLIDVEFCYDFSSNGIEGCTAGNTYLEAEVTGGSKDFIGDLAVLNNATFDGGAAPVNVIVDPAVTGDSTKFAIRIPVGDGADGQHCYTFTLELDDCTCYPRQYFPISMRVVEECADCDCTIVKACDSSLIRAQRNCDCVCEIQTEVTQLYRTTYGYSDKSLTTQLDETTAEPTDTKKAMPCDSVFVEIEYEVLDAFFVNQARELVITAHYEHVGAWQNLMGVELLPNMNQAVFEDFSFEKASNPGSWTPIEFNSLDCITGTGGQYRNENMGFFDAIGLRPNNSAGPNGENVQNSGNDGRGDSRQFAMWIYDRDYIGQNGNDCVRHLFDTQMGGLENGDKWRLQFKVPIQKNPYHILNDIVATTDIVDQVQFFGESAANSWDEGAFAPGGSGGGSRIQVANSCRSNDILTMVCPPEMESYTNYEIDPCAARVEHIIKLDGQFPPDCFANEYRPYWDFDRVSVPIPSPLVYAGNPVAVLNEGTPYEQTYPLSDPSFDMNITTASDGTTNFAISNSGTTGYATFDVSQLPVMGVGLSDPLLNMPVDSIVIRYDLERVCPGPISAPADFELYFDYSPPCEYEWAGTFCNDTDGDANGNNSFANLQQQIIVPGCDGLDTRNNPSDPDWSVPLFADGFDYHAVQDTSFTLNFEPDPTTLQGLQCSLTSISISDLADESEMNTYTVCATGTGTPHENVITSLTVPPTVSQISITDNAGNPITNTLTASTAAGDTYLIETPDLDATGALAGSVTCFEINVETELLFCPGPDTDTEICLNTSSTCIDQTIASQLLGGGGEACVSANCCYEYNAGETEIQAAWFSSNPIGPIPLCSEQYLEIVIKNTKQTTLTDLEFEFSLPLGLTVIPNSWEYQYPGKGDNYPAVDNSGPWTPLVPEPIATGPNIFGFGWDGDDTGIASVSTNGLPGINSGLDSNFISIRFLVDTECDEYTSNTPLYFEATAATPCETRISSSVQLNEGILIDNAIPSDFAQFLLVADPIEYTCGGPVPVSISGINLSETGGATDQSTACFKFGDVIPYTPGSFEFTAPGGFSPTVTETDLGGGITEVCFDLPDGISPQQFFSFNVELTPEATSQCQEVFFTGLVRSRLEDEVCEDGGTCDVFVNNTINSDILLRIASPVSIAEADFVINCDNDPENATYEYTLYFEGVSTTDYLGNATLNFYRDIDADSTLTAVDPILATQTTFVNVTSGEITEVTGTITLPEATSCPLFIEADFDVPCECSASIFYQSEAPTPDFLAQFEGGEVNLCPGDVLDLDVCLGYTYSLLPSAGGTITQSGTDLTIDINDGYGVNTPVVLTVSGGIGACSDDFTLDIYQPETFEIGPFETVNVCDNECYTVDIDLPGGSENFTYSWSPTTYLDDPTIAMPIICDPQADVIYTLTVTNPNNGCSAQAIFPVNVLNSIEPVINYVGSENCYLPYAPNNSLVVEPEGLVNYDFYFENGDADVLMQTGTSNEFLLPVGSGTFYVVIDDGICQAESDPIILNVPDCVFDVALTKVLNPSEVEPMYVGDIVTFDIEVCNQGTVPAQDIEVIDYIPAGFLLADNNWFDLGNNQASYTITGPILPDLCTTISIDLEVLPSANAGNAVNYAEILAADDIYSEGYPDIDSTPDGTNGNDNGGVIDSTTDDLNTDDGTIDEDDHDPADVRVEIFDLALTKTVLGAGPFTPGGSVTFEICVTNQGTVDAYTVELVDNIPAGLILNDTDWTLGANPSLAYFINIPGPIAANGGVVCEQITFDIDASFTGTSIQNLAEISSADDDTDPNNDPPTDIDSDPDDDPNNDGPIEDDDINNTNGDEDDHDPAEIMLITPECMATSNSPICAGDDLLLAETSMDGTAWSWTGPNGFTSAMQNPTVSPAVAGTYIVTVTDSNGFTQTCETIVEVSPVINAQGTQVDVLCNGDATGSIDVTVLGGTPPYTYDWDNDGIGDNDDFADLTDLTAGDYNLTITDAIGCTFDLAFTIAEPEALSCASVTPSNLLCFEDASGTLVVTANGGTMPYAYSVNGSPFQPGNTFSGLSAGAYVVTIEDANGCRVTCAEATIIEPVALSCTAMAMDANDCFTDNGTITATGVDGTTPYSYSIDGVDFTNTTGTFTDLGVGLYTIIVRDANGCESTCEAVVNAPEVPICEVVSTTNIACFGESTGEIIVTATGGSGNYEYSLDGVAFVTTGTFTGLSAGNYTITVRNVGNPSCTSECNVVLTELDELECEVIGTNLLCNSDNTGELFITAIGGSGDFEYSIDGVAFQLSNTFTGLAAGVYTVTTRDENNPQCTVECTMTITEPLLLECSLTKTDALCFGSADGTITVTAIGGTMAYEYSVDGVTYQPGNVFSGLPAGMHTITIRDVNACLTTCDITIDEPTALTCITAKTDATDCETDDGTITVTGAGGTTDYMYSLNGDAPQMANIFTDLAPGAYVVTIIDANGCESTCEADILAPLVPTCEIIASTNVSCFGLADGSLTAIGADGEGNYEYSLDGVNFQTSGVFTGLAAGFYTVTVTNLGDRECLSTCTVEITEPELLTCSLVTTPETCILSDGTITVLPTGGTMPYAYSLNGATAVADSIFTGLMPGAYTIDITDVNGCTTMCDITVETACFDLALIKEIDPNQPMPIIPGSDVTYNVTIINQGTVSAYDIEIVDYIPADLILNDPDWLLGLGGLEAFYNYAGPLAPGASDVIQVTFTIDPNFTGGIIENTAEISEADDDNDPNNEPPTDFDSNPDNDPNNDGPVTDNDTDNTDDDEDDADPAEIFVQIFDLALDKTVSPITQLPIEPGDNVTFDITVTNEGNVDAYNIEVTDYLPSYLIFNSALNGPNWIGNAVGAIYSEIDFLAVGQSTTLSITVTIDPDFQGDMIENTAEISDADDNDDPTDGTPDDIDSTPDGTNDDPEEEDDHDGEELPLGQTFDLALIKEIDPNQVTPINIGDQVDFVITVTNQGTLDAYNIEVVDYVPAGLMVIDANWSPGGSPNEFFYDFAGPLMPGESEIITLSTIVTPDAVGGLTTNYAEISQADDDTDPTNDPPTDSDSTPDSDNSNDGDPIDNVNDNSNGDEDDHDPEEFFIEIFDLALDKTVSPSTQLPIAPGDFVTFDINVTNEGNVDAFNIQVTDYLPSYLLFSSANNNPAWSADPVGAVYNVIPFVGVGATVTLQITVQIDPAYQGDMIENTAEISDADNDQDPTNDPPVDIDSDPDGTDDDPEEEDDHDGEELPLGQTFDLALIKQLVPSQPSPVEIGDLVQYQITVYNQGTLDAYNIEVVDYIPTGLMVVDPSWSVGTTPNEYFTTIPGPLMPGDFTQVLINTIVTADAIGGDTQNFAEIAQADDDTDPNNEPPTDFDSTPDHDPDNEGDYTDDVNNNLNGDEDDHDPANIFVQLFDLALNKTVSPSTQLPIAPGDFVTFDINVTNEGNVDAFNIQVTDYLPSYLLFSSANNNPAWSADPVGAVYNVIPSLAVGATVTLQITVQIDPAYQGDMIENTAEISDADDDQDPNNDPPTDIDSTPDGTDDDPEEEDDHDGEELPLGQTFDLALIKEVASGQQMPVEIGDVLEFVITVTNQGTLDAYNIEVVDYVPTGLTVIDGDWNVGAVPSEYFTTFAGPLLPGESVQIPLTTMVNVDAIGGVNQNFAEISSADDDTDPNNEPPTDFDSTPDNDPTDDGDYTDNATDNSNGDEDDHDPADFFVQLFDLALDKALNGNVPLPMAPGDIITFDLIVGNQGNVDAYNIQVTDYLPSYLIFMPGMNSSMWSADPVGAVFTDIDYLAVGTDTTVQIIVQIDPDYEGNMIENTAEISDADDDDDPTNDPPTDIDSTPDGTNDDPEEEDDHDMEEYPLGQTFDLALVKMVDPNQIVPIEIGDQVNYIITVYNQGTLTAYDIEVVDYVPAGLTVIDADWSVGANPDEYFTTISGPLLPGASQQLTLTTIVNEDAIGGTTQNFAEITQADNDTDPTNDPPTDIDSDPDSDVGNDGDYTDNDTDNTNGDEDDHDPADIFIQLFDLALDKTLDPDTELPLEPGSAVTFNITVTNEGNVNAYNIEVTDYLPTYLIFDPALNSPMWSADPAGALYSEIDFLAVGESTTLEITVNIDPEYQGNIVENTAEISDADDDDDPTNTPPTDIDSDPDGTNDDPEEEDDHDSEEYPLGQVFDLALMKTLAPGQSTDVAVGDVVSYEITVYNQGTLDAYNIQVVDYLPEGMMSVDPDWSTSGFNNNEVFTIIEGPLLVGESVSVTINVLIESMPADGSFVNVAEISEAEDEFGNNPPDADSDPDNNPDNDGNVTDDVIDGTNEDEDDSDPAVINVDFYDLALTKVVLNPADGMVTIGDQVTFEFEVFNQGSAPVANVTITDYIPAGLFLIDADWTTIASNQAEYTIPGTIAANSSVTVPITFTVLSSATPGDITNFGEISEFTDENGNPQDDADSTPDNNPDNDGPHSDNEINEDGNVNGQDEDDHDPATITFGIFDLALNKTLAGGEMGPFEPGDNVTFAITVFNQGTIDATNVTIVDYIQGGFILNDADWVLLNGNEAVYTVPGILEVGTQVTVNITLQIDPDLEVGGTLNNFAEISNATGPDGEPVEDVDSFPDDTNGNDGTITDDVVDNQNGDEDDHDIEGIEVEIFDLALNKTLAAGQTGPFTIGDIVTYNITITNQGTETATNIQIVDYVPEGLSLIGPANWIAGFNGDVFTTVAGPLTPNSSISVPIQFEITPDATSGSITNYAEIASAEDEEGQPQDDIDSTPDSNPDNDGPVVDEEINNSFGDEDDHDPETIEIEIFDLALIKTLAPGQANVVGQGDLVDFNITVTNQGSIDAYNVSIVDYIPSGFILNDADWNLVAANQAEYIIGGPIPVGGDIIVEITLEVASTTPEGDYTNFAEITGATDVFGQPQDDIDSTPDNDPDNDGDVVNDETEGSDGDEDDHDPADITVSPIPIFDLALTKTLAAGQPATVQPGDNVTYTFTIFNQGSVAASNIEITDSYPSGLTLIDGAWTDLGNNQASYTYLGTIQPGENVMVNVTFQLNANVLNTSLTNIGEISSATDDEGNPQDDIDSTPDDNPVNDGAPNDNNIDSDNGDEDDHDPATINIEVYDLALVKTLAPGQSSTVSIGDEITFIIEVFNQGNLPAYNVQVVDYTPEGLSLNDADWTLDIAGNAFTTIAGPIPPQSSVQVPVTMIVGASATTGDNTNVAEIAEFTDENNVPQDDVDSTPDATSTNDGPFNDNVTDGSNGDEDDSDPATFTIAEFDLALTKSLPFGADTNYDVGDQVAYIIQVYNQGDVPATNVVITDYLPSGLTNIDPNWASSGTNMVQTTITAIIAPGEVYQVPIVTQVNANATEGPLVNFAEISAATDENGNPQDDIDSTPDDSAGNDFFDDLNGDDNIDSINGDEDDHDPAIIYIGSNFVDVELTKTVNATVVTAGDIVTYTLTVINKGPQVATSVTVNDVLPAGLQYVSANGNYDPQTGNWNVGTLGVNETKDIDIDVEVIFIDGPIVNVAEVDTHDQEDIDSTPGDNNGSELVTDFDDEDSATIYPEENENLVDVELSKVVNATVVSSGDIVTYTLEVINKGPAVATNVTVSDILPAGLQYVSSNGNYDPQSGTWFVGTLGVNETKNIDIDVEVIFINGPIVNVAEVDTHDQEDIDSTPGDNNGSEMVTDFDDEDSATIYPEEEENFVDLELMKVVNALMVSAGDIVTYTVTVENKGPAIATNVEVLDILPAGLQYLTANGNYDPNTGIWTIGSLGVDESASIDISVEVLFINGPVQNIAEVESHDQPDIDSTPGNNNGSQTTSDEDDEDDVTIFPNSDEPDPTDCTDFGGSGAALCAYIILNPTSPIALADCDGGGVSNIEECSSGGNPFDPSDDNDDTVIIGNYVFIDENGNGVQDSGDTPVSGVVVNLYDEDGNLIDTTITDEDGEYYFEVDPNNTYYVEFPTDVPGGDGFTTPNAGNDASDSDASGNGLVQVNVGTDNDFSIDAGYLPDDTVFIGNYVFIDENGNGVQDSGDTPVSGVVVNLYDEDGNLIDTTITDEDGEYYFEVDPNNTYYVEFPTDVPGGDGFTTPNAGNDASDSDASGNGLVQVNVGTDNDFSIDAGYLPDDTVFIGNYVFIDENGNGVQDSGDTPVSGVVVNLYDEDGNLIDTTITDEDGEYYFEVDPNNTYYVEFPTDVPGGDGFTTPNAGNDASDSDASGNGLVQVNVGTDNDFSIDAGYLPDVVIIADCDNPIVCDNMEICTEALTPVIFCPSFCIPGTVYADYESLYNCSIEELPNGCLQYMPLPGMEVVGLDYIVIEGEAPDGSCVSITVDVQVGGCSRNIDLSLTKTANVSSAEVGDVIIYTIAVNNAGPDEALGVVVSDVLPTGLEFVSASTSTYNDGTGIWSVGDIEAGEQTIISISALVTQTGAITNTAQVVTADGDDIDSTPGNSVASEDDQDSAVVIVNDDCENPPMEICLGHMEAIEICPEFCDFGEGNPYTITTEYTITDIQSIYYCSIFQYSDHCFRYTGLPGFYGSDVVEVTGTDINGNTSQVIVYITVAEDCNATNEAPIANDDNTEAYPNIPVNIDILSNDTDPDGDDLTICSHTQPANGFLLLANGIFTFTPDADFVGTTSFDYTVCDGNGGEASATAYINVMPYECENEPMFTCTAPMTRITICPEFCHFDSDYTIYTDYQIIDVSSLYGCAYDIISDQCLTYIPLPGLEGTDVITVYAENEAGQVSAVDVHIEIFSECPNINDEARLGDNPYSCVEELPNLLNPIQMGVSEIVNHLNRQDCLLDKHFDLEIYNINGQRIFTHEGKVGIMNTPSIINEKDVVKGTYVYLIRMDGYDSVEPMTGTIIITR